MTYQGERQVIGDGSAPPVPYRTRPRIGTASSLIHHGELLQGVFHDDDGRLRRGLATMPCDLYSAQAAYTPMPIPSVVVEPAARVKAARAAQKTLVALGWPTSGGYLELIGNVPTSRGFGSSTSDVLATIWAVQDAFGCRLPESTVASIAVSAETASDSLMYSGRAVLFAQRDGILIEDFGCRLPTLAVVGFGTSRTGCGVDTLTLRQPNYRTWEINRFRELRDMLRTALHTGDVRLLGDVATASTDINQCHLPMETYDVVRPLVGKVGAVGLQTAHSGDIAGLVFDGRDPDVEAQQDRADALLRAAGITASWRFTTGG